MTVARRAHTRVQNGRTVSVREVKGSGGLFGGLFSGNSGERKRREQRMREQAQEDAEFERQYAQESEAEYQAQLARTRGSRPAPSTPAPQAAAPRPVHDIVTENGRQYARIELTPRSRKVLKEELVRSAYRAQADGATGGVLAQRRAAGEIAQITETLRLVNSTPDGRTIRMPL